MKGICLYLFQVDVFKKYVCYKNPIVAIPLVFKVSCFSLRLTGLKKIYLIYTDDEEERQYFLLLLSSLCSLLLSLFHFYCGEKRIGPIYIKC